MSIARVKSVEFDTPEDFQERIRFLEDENSQLKAMPDGVECFNQILTSDKSMLVRLEY